MTELPDIPEAEFREMAGRAWDGIPAKFGARIDNVALLVEDEPDEETRTREHLSEHETLLGLYHGIPAALRGESYGVGVTLPDTITLYRIPILEEADEFMREKRFDDFRDAVEEALRETLWHEVGHYFGLHEHEVRAREKKGTNRFK